MPKLISVAEAEALRDSFTVPISEWRDRISAILEADPPRIFQPIHYVAATGRASCRCCGQPIARDDTAIAFGFDSRAPAPGGHVGRAYIHKWPCRPPKED